MDLAEDCAAEPKKKRSRSFLDKFKKRGSSSDRKGEIVVDNKDSSLVIAQ